ncbi:MAG: tryptophan--tRNA ligase [Clostridia bacterium]|nr:tryptophan--tRNA ligase [Clostridia bacterium]
METTENRQTIFSGIQPTGNLTLGNYLGALKNMSSLQSAYDCIYCVVDMHSITVTQEPSTLRKKTYDLLALYLATGLDPTRSIIFVQSHVSAHAELTWVLNCLTYMGEASRMTQYKEKSKQHADNINVGLFDYPVLMASDILLYNTALVPIGQDQKQHLELARTLAQRFNAKYSPTFIVPEPYIAKVGGKIMSLANPTKKMSKSDVNENASIYLTDDADIIVRKVKRAVTDSDSTIRHSASKAGISNLIVIYSLSSGKSIKEVEKQFEGSNYGIFKQAVADSVIAKLSPIQQEQKRLLQDKTYLDSVLKEGAIKAETLARRTLAKVYRKVGLIPRQF